MKKYNFLWVIILMLAGRVVNSQEHRSIKSDPVAQLKQLMPVASIQKVSIKMVSIPMLSRESLAVGYDLKKIVGEAKMQCPYLRFESTLELEGKRNTVEEVGLEWKTINAFDGLYFDVERSIGDTTNFEKVNFVWSKDGWNHKKYELPDNNETEAVSYYRVKLQMIDGHFKYSNTIAVKGLGRNLFGVYPNPASTGFWLKLTSKEGGNANLTLFNAQGEKVKQQLITLSPGITREEIGIANLPAGIYKIIVVMPDKKIQTERIVKI